MPSFVRVYCSSWENTHMVLQSGPSSIWELLSFRPLLIFSIPHAHLSDSYSRLLRSVSLSIRKRRRLSFPDLIWVAKQKRVWNNPAECDLTHSGVRCSKRGLNIFLKNQVLEQIMAKNGALLRRSVLLLLFPSCLLCFPFCLCFSIFSWAPWVQPCWTGSQRRCGSMSKCCSASRPTSVQMQTRWPRFEL